MLRARAEPDVDDPGDDCRRRGIVFDRGDLERFDTVGRHVHDERFASVARGAPLSRRVRHLGALEGARHAILSVAGPPPVTRDRRLRRPTAPIEDGVRFGGALCSRGHECPAMRSRAGVLGGPGAVYVAPCRRQQGKLRLGCRASKLRGLPYRVFACIHAAPANSSARLCASNIGSRAGRQGRARSWMIDHDTPKRSRSILKREAKKVSSMGMYTSPPSASTLWTRSASATESSARYR